MTDHPSAKPRRFDRDVDGILLLDKPIGLSSNAALQQARGLFRALKAGHAGSLDPMATGMLPVCFGQATKVCAFLLDAYKTYQFTARLGERTDTGDAEGAIIERQPVPPLAQMQIEAVLCESVGEQLQVPPMYSALKHQGQRLYAIARRGESIERAPRRICIEDLTLLGFRGNELDVSVRCSKGTYVRTLAEDLAIKLGTVAHLVALRRVQVDPFGQRPMFSLDQLQERVTQGAGLDDLLIPADQALLSFPAIRFDLANQEALLLGRSAAGSRLDDQATPVPSATVRMYGPAQNFLGLGETLPGGLVQPRRLLVKSASGL